MDFSEAIQKRLVAFPFHFSKKHCLINEHCKPGLESIGLDALLNVMSYADGESMYQLACTSRFYKSVVDYPFIWRNSILDINSMKIKSVMTIIQQYGYCMETLELRGSASECLRARLYYAIKSYCTNLKFINSFGLPYLFPICPKTSSFSISFPSGVSDFLSRRSSSKRFMMYSQDDRIVQCMETHSQDLSSFTLSIWQFEILNNLEKGFSASFECFVNDYVVGSFTVEDSTVASSYGIDMLFPIPKCALSGRRDCLILSLRCLSHIPFGAGYVTISSMGRVSLLRTNQDVKYLTLSIPSFTSM